MPHNFPEKGFYRTKSRESPSCASRRSLVRGGEEAGKKSSRQIFKKLWGYDLIFSNAWLYSYYYHFLRCWCLFLFSLSIILLHHCLIVIIILVITFIVTVIIMTIITTMTIIRKVIILIVRLRFSWIRIMLRVRTCVIHQHHTFNYHSRKRIEQGRYI